MKRRTAHVLFGAAALIFTLSAGCNGWRLHQSERANDAIATAGQAEFTSTLPEAQLARAVAQSRSGYSEALVQQYKDLSRGTDAQVAEAALYNLGNLYMREVLQKGPDDAVRSLPLVELAKQSYRDVLRRNPANWDARYNLERALWLAPEVDSGEIESRIQVDSEERVRSTLQGTRIDLP